MWCALFVAHGYAERDTLALNAMRHDERVAPWYRRNLTIYRKVTG